jgi:hypothetical protein
VEPIELIYNNIKVIISAVILVIISSNSLVETPIQEGDIICPIVYSNLSTNKKTEY